MIAAIILWAVLALFVVVFVGLIVAEVRQERRIARDRRYERERGW